MIVVVADDLSGAAELAGAARARGLSAEVQTQFASESPADVLCVDSGGRALSPSAAGRGMETLIRAVVAARPAWIYLKFDSVLRGNVLAELRSAMAATGLVRTLLATANPSRGRIIRSGNYLIYGIPLHETKFASDPEHPRASSSVRELLGGEAPEVATPDVQHPTQLAALAATLDRDTIPAGSVEFFEAMLEARVPKPRNRPDSTLLEPAWSRGLGAHSVTLVACGSLASWTKRRQEALDRRVEVFDIFDDAGAVCGALVRDRVALVGIGDRRETGSSSPSELVERLSRCVAEISGKVVLDRLLLEGGATAAAIVSRLGWTRLTALPGVDNVVGGFRPAEEPAPVLFIKPGSYEWPASLW